MLELSNNFDPFKEGDKWGYVSRNEYIDIVIPAIYDVAYPFKGEYACVKIDHKWGYIDKRGDMVVPVVYDWISSFDEDGIAVAKFNNGWDSKWGFIDIKRNLRSAFIYDNVWSFYDGLASVKLNGKWGFIDKDFNLVIPSIYDHVCGFENGFAKVEINGKEKVINKNGNEVEV